MMKSVEPANRPYRLEELIRVVRSLRLERPTGGLDRQLQDVADCIHDHFHEHGFNVERLRRLCRIRDNNLSTRFRLVTGEGLRASIERLRLEAAAHLLSEYAADVLEVGFAVGYEHPQTFFRAFKRRFGSTPGDFASRAAGTEVGSTPPAAAS